MTKDRVGNGKGCAPRPAADRAATPAGPSREGVSGIAGITGAPWSIRKTERPNGGHWREIMGGEGGETVIGELYEDRFSEPNEPTIEEAEANARLIAAAPDLFEALVGLIAPETLASAPAWEAALRTARAALAKVRDGQ